MKKLKFVTIILLLVLTAACTRLSRNDTEQWLSTKTEASKIDMTGEWTSGGMWSGGWGSAKFIQEGRRFTGSIGMYYAEGVVSGDHLYLVLYSGRKVYYTAILKQTGTETYMGKAVYRVLADKPEANQAQTYLLSLKRIKK